MYTNSIMKNDFNLYLDIEVFWQIDLTIDDIILVLHAVSHH